MPPLLRHFMSTSDDIKRNSHNIWLAGLGAFASIDQTGQAAFDQLVEKGQRLETENAAEKPSGADSKLDELKMKANQTMDRIERSFDLRVSSTLNRLGITSKADVDALNARINELNALVAQLRAELEP
ncbi:Poly granule associated protein [gamma proteobacterium HdN1]|nr:Poly granule associated protein [gamma proteobacterium HdN1]